MMAAHMAAAKGVPAAETVATAKGGATKAMTATEG